MLRLVKDFLIKIKIVIFNFIDLPYEKQVYIYRKYNRITGMF